MGDRVVRWFYGLPNIIGIVAVLVGIGLYLAGVISGWLVPLICVGLYLVAAFAVPRPHGIGAGLVGDADFDPDAIKKALQGIVDQSKSRLPDDLAAKVASIQSTILDILPRVNASSVDRRDLFVLQRTAADYLPNTLNNYLTLPRAYADTRVISDGKTAKQLLGEQLDLIDQQLQEISEAVAKDDVTKLLAQGRFLEERFGQNNALALPDATPDDPTAPAAAAPAPPAPAPAPAAKPPATPPKKASS
jgi:hypothetical protein